MPKRDLTEVVTVPEAAALTGISQQRIKDAITRKTIFSRKSGGTHLLYRSDVIAKWKPETNP